MNNVNTFCAARELHFRSECPKQFYGRPPIRCVVCAKVFFRPVVPCHFSFCAFSAVCYLFSMVCILQSTNIARLYFLFGFHSRAAPTPFEKKVIKRDGGKKHVCLNCQNKHNLIFCQNISHGRDTLSAL